MKLIISSRPDDEFKEIFRGFPNMEVQDLTSEDIKRYVQDIIQGHINEKKFRVVTDDELVALQSMVVEKAERVFLWVYYALKSLMEEELGLCSSFDELIRELP